MKRKWNATAMELYAERWLNSNGFKYTLKKETCSKSYYDVERDGVVMELIIDVERKDCARFMDWFDKEFAGYVELRKLRELVRR